MINNFKKIGLIAIEFPEMFDRCEFLSVYLKSKNSEFITSTLKDIYQMYLKQFEIKNTQFKLIDALEQASAIGIVNTLLPDLRKLIELDLDYLTQGKEVMSKFGIRQFPEIFKRGEDMGVSRVGPFMPINPLKAHKANPTFNTPKKIKLNRPHFSNAKTRIYRGYCTLVKCENFNTLI